jgi:hypothetical protein
MANRRWSVLWTTLFSYAVGFLPIAAALAMGLQVAVHAPLRTHRHGAGRKLLVAGWEDFVGSAAATHPRIFWPSADPMNLFALPATNEHPRSALPPPPDPLRRSNSPLGPPTGRVSLWLGGEHRRSAAPASAPQRLTSDASVAASFAFRMGKVPLPSGDRKTKRNPTVATFR